MKTVRIELFWCCNFVKVNNSFIYGALKVTSLKYCNFTCNGTIKVQSLPVCITTTEKKEVPVLMRNTLATSIVEKLPRPQVLQTQTEVQTASVTIHKMTVSVFMTSLFLYGLVLKLKDFRQ